MTFTQLVEKIKARIAEADITNSERRGLEATLADMLGTAKSIDTKYGSDKEVDEDDEGKGHEDCWYSCSIRNNWDHLHHCYQQEVDVCHFLPRVECLGHKLW